MSKPDAENLTPENGVRKEFKKTGGQNRDMQKALQTICLQGFLDVGLKGFEPSTSASRTQRSSQAELQPEVGFV